MGKSLVISSVIITQLVIIGVLGLRIYNKKAYVLGQASVAPLNRDAVEFKESGKLAFYYEPLPSSQAIEEKLPWLSEEVIYDINADTLRETTNYSEEKQENTFRTVTLGDSFTYGLYVNTKDSWPEVLERKLNSRNCKTNVEVINLAVPGYDIEYSVERYKVRGQKYNPDLVLWFLKDDDFDQVNELMRKNEQRYLDEMYASGEFQRLREEGVQYPAVPRIHQDMEKIKIEMGEEKLLALQEEYMRSLYSFYDNKLLLVTYSYVNNRMKDVMKSVVSDGDGSLVEIPSIYQDATLSFEPQDYHPNKKGHSQMAEDMYVYLQNKSLVPCL